MNSHEKNKGVLDLERDIPLTAEDFRAMRQTLNGRDDRDLGTYLDFLEEIGAFKTKKTDVKIYSEQFKL